MALICSVSIRRQRVKANCGVLNDIILLKSTNTDCCNYPRTSSAIRVINSDQRVLANGLLVVLRYSIP